MYNCAGHVHVSKVIIQRNSKLQTQKCIHLSVGDIANLHLLKEHTVESLVTILRTYEVHHLPVIPCFKET